MIRIKIISFLFQRAGILLVKENEKLLKFIQKLTDKDKHVRRNTAIALRYARINELRGNEQVVSPLIQALKNEDSNVRYNVANILGEIGDERAVKPLIHALEDNNRFVRSSAAGALVKCLISQGDSLAKEGKTFREIIEIFISTLKSISIQSENIDEISFFIEEFSRGVGDFFREMLPKDFRMRFQTRLNQIYKTYLEPSVAVKVALEELIKALEVLGETN